MAKKITSKSKTSILVADDDPTIRLTVRQVLERDGHKVIEALDGQQALTLYQQHRPDLVLLDAIMPELDGFETCTRLCQLPGGDQVPILFITALNDAESVSRAFEVGATDYIVKPIHWTVLRRRVRHMLQVSQAELSLRESEERYRTLVETSPDTIFLLDPDFNILFCNQQAVSLLGCDNLTELLGRNALEFIAPEDHARILDPNCQNLNSNSVKNFECTLLKNKGSRFSAEVSASHLANRGGQLEGIVIVARDISQRKQAEAETRRRNRELTLLNQIIATSATSLEPEGVLDVVCRELAVALDITQATVSLFNQTKTILEVVAEHDVTGRRPSMLNNIIPVVSVPAVHFLLAHQAPLVIADTRIDTRLAGIGDLLRQRGVISLLALPLVVEGEVMGVLSLTSIEPHTFLPEEVNLAWSVADQAAGVLARAALTQTRQRLSAAVEQTAESVIIIDANGLITYVNPAFERTTGYTRSDVIGQNSNLLRNGQEQDGLYQELWGIISTGKVWHGRLVNKKKNGSLYTAEATITPVRGENREITSFVEIQRDVTHQLQLEEQLRQTQKMEAIGRMAGGIAHDFNNLLTVITGYSELLLARYLGAGDPGYEEVEQIKKAGERATALTQQLLAFSRKQPLQPQVLNLNKVIDNIQPMLHRLAGKEVKLRLDLEPNLAQVTADPGQLEQVIMNLVVNARDAMPLGGKLVIETTNVVLNEPYAGQSPKVTPGPYILLSVSDTGMGMDKEILSHIFEPFFTTKDKGKGTGLGLATVHSIVTQNGGQIWVESELGRGTRFNIYLPQVQVLTEPAHPQAEETILVVEDEVSA